MRHSTRHLLALRRRFLSGAAALLLLAGLAPSAFPAVPADDPTPAALDLRVLRLEDVELEGATRTSRETVLRFLPLAPGQAIDQVSLVAAVEELRDRRLFESVDFYTRPGSGRGRLVLVLEVEEHGVDFRWAAGNTDLDGWYLVPAMVAWENVSGRADYLDLQWRAGFRHGGMLLNYLRPHMADGRTYWGARLGAVSTERPYVAGGVEYRHEVKEAGVGMVLGRGLGDHWIGELGLAFEGVDVVKESVAFTASGDGTVSIDDEVSGDALPAPVRDVVGQHTRLILHADLQHDTRAERKRAGTPVGGFWGRLKTTARLQGKRSHVGVLGDIRHYAEVPGGVAALRLRGQFVTDQAPFHDRLYLGGMYSARGFGTHSLSAPGGDTWLASGSLEWRTRILPDRRGGTRLAGLLFLDAGASGGGEPDFIDGVSLSTGYGVRWKVWWLDWIGLDVGFPLTDRALDHRFQVNASIGWSF